VIQFEDAKRQVESLFGSIRGYKLCLKTFSTSSELFPIGDNYVFVGVLNNLGESSNTYSQFIVGDVNGEPMQIYWTYPGNTSNMSTIEFIGKDINIGNGITLVDNTTNPSPNAVQIYGWVFQIDK
jgi:hypothetical protein